MTDAVSANVREVRAARGLTQQELAGRLDDLGHPIKPSGIAKVEAGSRRVDVDDLVAFAAALDVAPPRLLLPPSDGDESVEIMQGIRVEATAAWDWLSGAAPLMPGPAGGGNTTNLAFEMGKPQWLREIDSHAIVRASRELLRAAVAMSVPQHGDRREAPLSTLRVALRRVALEADHLQEATTDGSHSEAGSS